ncbi:RNaseH domain-containing protein, partial [Streptomyces anulatus]
PALGCLGVMSVGAPGGGGEAPDRPAEWATLTHQLRYHDDYPPLARPLPLHLARLAGQYVLPMADGTENGRRTEGAESGPSAR